MGAQGQGSASSPSRSRSATPSARSSRSTPTRSTSVTARTASRRPRASTSASPRRDLTLEEAAPDRRHHPVAESAKSLRQPGGRAAPPQLRAGPDGGGGLHQRRAGRQAARKTPIVTAGLPIRRQLGGAVLRRGGAQVPRSQVRGEAVLRERAHGPDLARSHRAGRRQRGRRCGLRALDKRRGFRKPARNVVAEGARPEAFGPAALASADGSRRHRAGRGRPPWSRRAIRRSRGRSAGRDRPEGFAWTGRTTAGRAGEGRATSSRSGSTATDAGDGDRLPARSSRRPSVEGAVLAHRQPHRARSWPWSAATASSAASSTAPCRPIGQLGSTFKPFVYTAAIDRGFTPASIVLDTPVSSSARPRPAAVLRRPTTTASGRARSRCVARSSSRATCPPCA